MSDYTPTVTRDDIDRIIRRDYPQATPKAVWDILHHYGTGEAYRVYAAALKQGEGHLSKLKDMIELANSDYRDLLVAAEYPAQADSGLIVSPTDETIRMDREQYESWFKK